MIVSSNAFVFSTCLLVLVFRYGITQLYKPFDLYNYDIIYFQNSYYSIVKVVFMLDLAHRKYLSMLVYEHCLYTLNLEAVTLIKYHKL